MTRYTIAIEGDSKRIFSGHIRLGGSNPTGEELRLTNYYLERNGVPFFGICGEFHFSRYDRRFWEDELIKMRMGGVNIVSTYVFWNLHEEVRGCWDWDGNNDLRSFVELCAEHDLYVIIRIGPFDHGEMRNGGIPDWLFGRPFRIRSNDEEYLRYVRTLYTQISEQVRGLLYKDGGPVIGTQLENEHNHSAAVWAHTAGTSDTWMHRGHDGDAHLLKLKEIAKEVGIQTPLYTCTAWGGASMPVAEMLPLWGGYAFRPWIFYESGHGSPKVHPPTPEYIFRDKHNNAIPVSYNFEPQYPPEDYPYACCEMGGGMVQFYRHRFEFPYISVPAMTGVKAAEGCNFLGYYMYHGGSNPLGVKSSFVNDPATPKISYDYDALIGEFGQVRESYRRTKLQHLFFTEFAAEFCLTKTTLPGDTSQMDPSDVDTLRYAVRSRDGSGFLFVNNYQDHADTKPIDNVCINLELEHETIVIPGDRPLQLDQDSFCMLPFNLDLSGVLLKYSTTQLITRLSLEEEYYFFLVPRGMTPEYCFRSEGVQRIDADGADITRGSETTTVSVSAEAMSFVDLTRTDGSTVHICTVTDEQSLDFWKAPIGGRDRVVLTSSNLLVTKDRVRLESTGNHIAELSVFPPPDRDPSVDGGEVTGVGRMGRFTTYTATAKETEVPFEIDWVADAKAVLRFTEQTFSGVKEVLLRIDYAGDVGYAFIDGELINDNFCNGTTWEIGLNRYKDDLLEKGMYLYISPRLEGASVDSDTTMAGWAQSSEPTIAAISSVTAVPVYETSWKFES
jgi:glycosyl hydrolase family 35